MLPRGSSTGSPAPTAAAIGSSIKNTLRAPLAIAASRTARFSTSVTPLGTQITTRLLIVPCAFRMKYRSICLVVSKSAITPSFIGLIATIAPGVRPIMRLASSPIAKTSRVCEFIATTDGSFIIIPLPREKTNVFAVPKSIPKSFENIVISYSFNCISIPNAGLSSSLMKWPADGILSDL
jgi:hypothetical protein